MKEMKTFLSFLTFTILHDISCFLGLKSLTPNNFRSADSQFFSTILYPRRENHFGRLEIEPKFTWPLKPPDHSSSSFLTLHCLTVFAFWSLLVAYSPQLKLIFFCFISSCRAVEKNCWWQASNPRHFCPVAIKLTTEPWFNTEHGRTKFLV